MTLAVPGQNVSSKKALYMHLLTPLVCKISTWSSVILPWELGKVKLMDMACQGSYAMHF